MTGLTSVNCQRHVKEGANHYACVTMGENFLMVARGEQICVADQVNVQHRQLVERNRQILTKIPEVIILCGRQNILIRGHSEEDSNFTAILTPFTIQSPSWRITWRMPIRASSTFHRTFKTN